MIIRYRLFFKLYILLSLFMLALGYQLIFHPSFQQILKEIFYAVAPL